jgi:A/G-specific adenine glycosylase
MQQPSDLATTLLQWYRQHGRVGLPWRQTISSYHVWVSEIMLQQTQVATALPYFNRFITRFPTLEALARAELSDVLILWSGLGYYARARNLHRTAQLIMQTYQGIFPIELNTLCELPGIGRSTAGAILAIAQHKFGVILDGNVRRILTRLFCLTTPSLNELWDHATRLTSKKHAGDYAQAIMDLGALICLPKNPKCEQCPIVHQCQAAQTNRVTEFPVRVKKKTSPTRQAIWLIVQNPKGEILLCQQPPTGLWGGLWCFPAYSDLDTDPLMQLQKQFNLKTRMVKPLPNFTHIFSHFRLDISPWLLRSPNHIFSTPHLIWYHGQSLATPSPVTQLLKEWYGS